MAVNPQTSEATPPAAFELKAASFTFPVIRLLGADMDAVAEQLGAKVDQAPDFFRNTPVVVDLSGLAADTGDVQFPLLVGLLRGYGMIPVGVRGGDATQNGAAEAMELAILGDVYVRKFRAAAAKQVQSPSSKPSTGAVPQSESPVAKPSSGTAFKLVTQPVRSGQRVYAAGGDLSVVGPVSSGAELLADGNIHVYGPLRGRAMAGLSGDPKARVFCQDLQAELVSVAGHYRISENIPEALKGVPVQIFLDQEVLRIEKL
jgi:septum site-determining protein MinC